MPIVRRVVNGARRVMTDPGLWWAPLILIAFALAIITAAVCYRFVERQFQTSGGGARYDTAPESTVAVA